MSTQTFPVTGMTCGHCVSAVTSEVSALPGVTDVQVDLVARSQSRCGSRPVVLHELPDNAQALLELRTGRAVAVLSDYPPAAELANGPRSSTTMV